MKTKKCEKKKKYNKCHKDNIKMKCQKTCGFCETIEAGTMFFQLGTSSRIGVVSGEGDDDEGEVKKQHCHFHL